MKIIRDIKNIPAIKNAVLTIGTYDGVHQGHQQIIKKINKIAAEVEGESVIITFHPHPRSIINNNRVQLLSPLNEKFELMQLYEVNNVVVVPFTRSFSQQSPEAYVHDFLYQNFKPHTVVIGYDHRFGKDRKGDIHFLKEQGQKLGFQVEEISKQVIDNISVSSTKIRNALNDGKVEVAKELLGHPYTIEGTVVRGQQLGRQIGFPTANIQITEDDKLIPLQGVYAVRVLLEKQTLNGMLNIGTRPTVGGESETIEVNIFDFEEDIYGQHLKLEFVQHIRAEQQFAGLKELVDQLQKDKETVLTVLENS